MMMKRELEIFGFFLLFVASWWVANLAFAAMNQPSTVALVVGIFVIVLLILLWASVLYKLYLRVLLPYLNKAAKKERKIDEDRQ